VSQDKYWPLYNRCKRGGGGHFRFTLVGMGGGGGVYKTNTYYTALNTNIQTFVFYHIRKTECVPQTTEIYAMVSIYGNIT
jgi:hypothetical protein